MGANIFFAMSCSQLLLLSLLLCVRLWGEALLGTAEKVIHREEKETDRRQNADAARGKQLSSSRMKICRPQFPPRMCRPDGPIATLYRCSSSSSSSCRLTVQALALTLYCITRRYCSAPLNQQGLV